MISAWITTVYIAAIPLAAEAAKLVGIDERLDQVVSIDIDRGEVIPLATGPNVRANHIVWSPDESVAYLLSTDRNQVVVYDAIEKRVANRFDVERPTAAVFDATRPRAYIVSCGIAVVDTTEHKVVEWLPGSPNHLLMSSSGRRLYAVSGESITIHDRWLGSSQTFNLWRDEPTWGYESIEAVALAFGGESLAFATQRAVWTFEPLRQIFRAFPHPGRGMGFAVPHSLTTAVLVTDRDIARIDLASGETTVRRLDAMLYSRYGWDPKNHVTFTDDGATVAFEFGDRLQVMDTESMTVLWEVPLDHYDLDATVATPRTALLHPTLRGWRNTGEASLVHSGAHAPHPPVHLRTLRDIAWRSLDRSFYALTNAGLEQIAEDGSHEIVIADTRFGTIALDNDRIFVAADGDGTIREIDVAREATSDPILHVEPYSRSHRKIAIAADRENDEVLASSAGGLDVVSISGGRAQRETHPDLLGFQYPMEVLAGGVLLSGNEDGAVHTLDLSSHTLLAEHEIGGWNWSIVDIEREPSGEAAVVGASHNPSDWWQATVARIDADGIISSWVSPWGTGLTAAAPAGEGEAVIGLINRTSPAYEIRTIDVATGTTLASIAVASRVNELVSDGSVAIALLDGDTPLIAVDLASGSALGRLEGDFRIARAELIEADWGLAALAPFEPTGQTAPPGVTVAAAADYKNIITWVGTESRFHSFDAVDSRAPLAFSPSGVLYIGTTRRRDNRYQLLAIDPSSGNLLHSIDLPGAAGSILPTPDGTLLFVPTHNGIAVFDALDSTMLSQIQPGDDWRNFSISDSGTTIVAATEDGLGWIDTRVARWGRQTLGEPPLAHAAVEYGAYYVTAAGELFRIDFNEDDPPQRLDLPQTPRRVASATVAATAGRVFAHLRGDCSGHSAIIDTDTKHATLIDAGARLRGAAWFDDILYTVNSRSIDLWDPQTGHRTARLLPDPALHDYDDLVSAVIGCSGDCRPAAPISDRGPWSALPTPTATATPTATPTPGIYPTARDRAEGSWLGVTSKPTTPGGIVGLRVSLFNENQQSEVHGFQADIWLPRGIHPLQWHDGQALCLVDEYDADDARIATMLLPRGCRNTDCRGFRLHVAHRWNLAEDYVSVDCSAKVADDAESRLYPIQVEHLYLAATPPADHLQAIAEPIVVLENWATPIPTVGLGANPHFGAPTPAPAPSMLLRGLDIHSETGRSWGIPFYLSGNAVPPLRDHLRAIIDVQYPLSILLDAEGQPICGANDEQTHSASFTIEPGNCGDQRCTRLIAAIDVDPGPTGFESGDPPRWLFQPDAPIFQCDFRIDEWARGGEYLLRISDAVFGDRSLETRDARILAREPFAPPTRTPSTTTGSPTPTPLSDPRPCTPENGRPVLCIADTEADAGGSAMIDIVYRAGQSSVAGIEFELVVDWPLRFTAPPPEAADLPTSLRFGYWCGVDEDLMREASAFSRYDGGIKALILSFKDLSPLPDGAVVARCEIAVADEVAPGHYPLRLELPGASDGKGNEVDIVGREGTLRIRGPLPPTVTPSPTPPTVDEAGSPPTATAARRSDALQQSGNGSAGGCAVAHAADQDSLALPWFAAIAIGALLRRRRGIRRRAIRRRAEPM